jgi:hypothetical protein
MNRAQAKRTMDELLTIQSRLSDFHEKQATPQVRKELSGFIKTLTNEHDMVREDKDKVVHLWTSQFYKDHGMSSDIEIYGATGTIYVCDDSLWRTIKGLDEVVRGD